MLAGESGRWRIGCTLLLALTMVAFNFTQLGFLTISVPEIGSVFVIGLLAPLCAAGLLLGPWYGLLLGVFAGATLALHASIQPLDYYELTLVGPITSTILFGIAGFLSGMFYAVALRNNPRGIRRICYILLAGLIYAFLFTIGFAFMGAMQLVINFYTVAQGSEEVMSWQTNVPEIIQNEGNRAILRMLTIVGQFRSDVLIVSTSSILTDTVVHLLNKRKKPRTLSDVFRLGLLLVVYVAFVITTTVGFSIITMQESREANDRMSAQIEVVNGQLEANAKRNKALTSFIGHAQYEEYEGMQNDLQIIVSDENPISGLEKNRNAIGLVVISNASTEAIIASNDEMFAVGEKLSDNLSLFEVRDIVGEADSGSKEMLRVVLDDVDVKGLDADSYSLKNHRMELAYARAMKVRYNDVDCIVTTIMPAGLVFANRATVGIWTTLSAFVLLIAVYIVTQLLIKRFVIRPIDHTNEALGLITDGNLNAQVEADETPEFMSLSDGINNTVGALKRLISEAEHRNEMDLATGKAIQASALPRTFPPFPEIESFDIYARMDAAKEVGGDFYDFFLVDDCTLAFLIADVSGKGIPGALFMMAAKAEIQNYLSTGMSLSEAILSANRRLCASNDAGMFVTVWAATLNWETGELNYVNAGHNFPLLRHGEGGDWEWLKKKCGLFLGTFETARYKQETLVLEPGDEILLYTDGVNEAFNVEEQEYGNDRLEAFLAAHNGLRPKEIVKSLREDVAKWANGAEQSDDVTILALEYGIAPNATSSLTLEASLDNLEEAMRFVSDELERRLCPAGAQRKVEVAFEELYVNVCRYAYASSDEPGEVQVSYIYKPDPKSITIELRDRGVAFDPTAKADPKRSTNIDEIGIGGLGIYMVRKSMDDFSYVRDGEYNVVAIKKLW